MKDHTYNGWKNYETWVTALWIDNERADYEQVIETVNEIRSTFEKAPIGDFRIAVADYLKTFVEGIVSEQVKENSGLTANFVNASLFEVDWYEIANHYIEV